MSEANTAASTEAGSVDAPAKITIEDLSKFYHYNVGYCRYKDNFKFNNLKEYCENKNCSFRTVSKDNKKVASLE